MIEGTACSYCGLIDVHAAWCAHEAARRDDLKLLEVIDRQLEIERKARAWDSLRHILAQAPAQITPGDVLRRMDGLAGPRSGDQDQAKG